MRRSLSDPDGDRRNYLCMEYDPDHQSYHGNPCRYDYLYSDSDDQRLYSHSQWYSDGQCIAGTNGQQRDDLCRAISNIDRYRRGNISMEHHPDHQPNHRHPSCYDDLYSDSDHKRMLSYSIRYSHGQSTSYANGQ